MALMVPLPPASTALRSRARGEEEQLHSRVSSVVGWTRAELGGAGGAVAADERRWGRAGKQGRQRSWTRTGH